MVFIKTVLRMFKKNILRFIFLTGIIFLGISFVSGLSISGGVVKSSVSDYYQESKVTDLIIKTTEITGIRNSDINTIKDLEFVEDAYPFTSLDVEVDEYDYRIYLLDYENLAFNTVTLLEGNYPENYNQVLIEKNGSDEFSYQIGDTISIPVNLRFNFNATTPVVPLPKNGSSIKSFSFVEAKIILSNNASGFWAT